MAHDDKPPNSPRETARGMANGHCMSAGHTRESIPLLDAAAAAAASVFCSIECTH